MSLSKLNDFVWASSSIPKPNIPEKQHYGYLTGWVCPKCGRVYGPFIEQCFYCNSSNYTVTCIYEQ